MCAAATWLPRGKFHQLHLSVQCRDVAFPRPSQPVGEDGGNYGTLNSHAVAPRSEFARINTKPIRASDPRYHRGERGRVSLCIQAGVTVTVKKLRPGLKHQGLDRVEVVFPEVEQIPIWSAVAIEILDQGPEDAAEIVPRFNLRYVDTSGFDDVGAITQEHGMHIMG